MAHEQVGIGGGIRVPMAIPLTCRKCQELKEKLLWVRINSVSWRRNQVDGGEGTGPGNVPGQRGHGYGMLVYREETSTVAMMVSGGRELCLLHHQLLVDCADDPSLHQPLLSINMLSGIKCGRMKVDFSPFSR